jgi:hypothetical protein
LSSHNNKSTNTRQQDIVNIHGSGQIDINFTNDSIYDNLRFSQSSNLQFEIGSDYAEPAIPISSLTELTRQQFRFFNILYESRSNVLRINRNGTFTILSKTLKQYIELFSTMVELWQQMKSDR